MPGGPSCEGVGRLAVGCASVVRQRVGGAVRHRGAGPASRGWWPLRSLTSEWEERETWAAQACGFGLAGTSVRVVRETQLAV
jgi:hypothetical protein